MAEPALQFWLDFVEAEGGLFEQRGGDKALAVLPPSLQEAFGVPEEFTVSSDPEVAREEGALLLIPGHPLLDAAATAVLGRGDVGRCHLGWPRSVRPSPQELLERARDQLAVDHGRIDLGAGPPSEVYLPVLRVGAMIHYAVSLEDRFQEREEVWVDGLAGLLLADPMLSRLAACRPVAGSDPSRPLLPPDPAALSAANQEIERRAAARQGVLARHTERDRQEELTRASAFYDAALASLNRRRESAPAERQALLDARARGTEAERARRLAEIEEKFHPRHEVRPFRLHLVGVPTLALPVHIRRGTRVFPLLLTWVLPAEAFARVRCPRCRAAQTLVAGREYLGCRTCMPPPSPAPPTRALERPTQGPPNGKSGSSSAPPSGTRAERQPAPRQTLQKPEPPRTVARGGPNGRLADPARVRRAGSKLALSFWEAAVTGQRWRGRGTVGHSPLAALLRLYGRSGPLWAIGLPPGAMPWRLIMETADPTPGLPHTTIGALLVDGVPYTYTLRWVLEAGAALVGEVLPYPQVRGVELPPRSWLHPRIAACVYNAPGPTAALDPVASVLCKNGIARHGLPLVLRGLALWWWAEELGLGAGYPARAVAAAVTAVTARRSGRRMSTQDVSFDFESEPALVGELARAVMGLLKESGDRPW